VSERIRMVITVKAYPAISNKYGEVVCVAGIRIDVEPYSWVRLWPVPFRELHFDQRFSKYDIIEIEVDSSTDSRPESVRPNLDSLQILQGKRLPPGGPWPKRRPVVEPLLIDSMCQLQQQQRVDGTSLGVFRPAEVTDLVIEDDTDEWKPGQSGKASQSSLFFPNKGVLEKIPCRFKYRYRCSDPQCRGHEQSIVDWEIAESYRNWRSRYPDEATLRAKIKQKYFEQMCDPKRDTAFFAGNMHLHPEAFLILGVFWPMKI